MSAFGDKTDMAAGARMKRPNESSSLVLLAVVAVLIVFMLYAGLGRNGASRSQKEPRRESRGLGLIGTITGARVAGSAGGRVSSMDE